MAKQSDYHKGIHPRHASSEAQKFILNVRHGIYGKLPNLSGLCYGELVFLACVDGIAAEMAEDDAGNHPLTADQLRVKIMRNMAERILRAEGDVRDAYSPVYAGEDE